MATLTGKFLLIALFGVVLVQDDCLAATVLFQCDFEKGDICGMEQDTMDTPCSAAFQTGCKDNTFSWILHTSKTPTDGTGPDAGNKQSQNYLYMESSNARKGNFARLFITDAQLQGYTGTVCVQFYYHMYSKLEDTVGELSIEYVHNNESYGVWNVSGNQPNSWMKQNATVVIADTGKIALRGTLGSTAFSDLALDDISVMRGSCDGSTSDDENEGTNLDSTTGKTSTSTISTSIFATSNSTTSTSTKDGKITLNDTNGGDSKHATSLLLTSLCTLSLWLTRISI